MPGRRNASAPDERTPVDTPVLIESLDREGRGVGRVEGKAMFVEGALPGERVTYAIIKRKPSYELGELMEVVQANAARSAPACRHFGLCGGCSLQHFEARAQVAAKQRILEDAFWHIGRLRPESMLSPILGPSWGYRRRARLSARWVIKKEKALVGFR
jgi:23S rRNA (uracil1939-C5)-methyltransferase